MVHSTSSNKPVLRERQLQGHASSHPIAAPQAEQHKSSVSTHDAAGATQPAGLARLQAQRIKRAEQRLAASALPVIPCSPSSPQQHMQGSEHVLARQPSAQRVRAKVTTTAGSGMQRQAPSRCSSTACSVRTCLVVPQQQPQLSARWAAPSVSCAGQRTTVCTPSASARTSSATTNNRSKLHDRLQQRQSSGAHAGWKRVHPAVVSSSAASQQLRPQGGVALLHVQGSSVQQQQHAGGVGDNTCCSMAVQPICHLALPGSGIRLQQQQQQQHAVACMGCGASWQELHTAVVAMVGPARCLPGSNLERRRHTQQCRQAAVQLVMRQWKWFIHSRRTFRAAACLPRRRLLNAGWQGLCGEVRRMQLLRCKADLQATKQGFMLLSRAFSGWQQRVLTHRRLESVTDTLQAQRCRQVLRDAVDCWRDYLQLKRQRRQLLLRAEACYVFMTQLRAVQQWRTYTTDKQVARLKAARADQHRQQVVSRQVLCDWQDAVTRAAAKWQALAKALCFHKCKLLTKVVQAWAEAAQHQHTAREAAAAVLQHVAQQLEVGAAARAFQAWQQAAQLQVEHRQVLCAAAGARQRRCQQQVLLHWQQLVAYHRQLAVAADRLQQLEPVWWLQHSFTRWQVVAQVLAGQQGEELQQLVQLRACLGTWLKYTERRRHKAGLLSAAKGVLDRKQRARLLPAWMEVTAQMQKKHQQQQLAEQHYLDQLQRRVLLVWQDNAAEAVVERLQLTAAAELHRLRLLTAGLNALSWYHRYLQLKAAAPLHYQNRLVLRAVTGWQQRTAAKQGAEQLRRLAVRSHYRATLGKVLRSWVSVMDSARHKHQQHVAAQAHYGRRLLAAVLQAWHGPFLQHQRRKQQQHTAADAFARQHMLSRCLSAWGAAMADRRAKRVQAAEALRCMQHRLLQHGFAAFQLAAAEAQQDRQRLAAAAAPAINALARLKQRSVMRAWHLAAQRKTVQQQQAAVAQQHLRRVMLSHSLSRWRRYMLYRRHKAAQSQLATRHWDTALLTHAVAAFQQRVRDAAQKRQRAFVAAMHRRSWLIRRAFRAWRLSAAVSHLECILLGAAATSSTGNQQQVQQLQRQYSQSVNQQCSLQPYQGAAAVAAAVVETSCAAHRQWQQQWCNRWQQVIAQPGHVQAGHNQELQSTAQQQQNQETQLLPYQVPCSDTCPSLLHPLHAGSNEHAPVTPAAVDATHRQLQLQHMVPSTDDSSRAGRAPRRQPRLPSFMQHELLLQQQQPLVGEGCITSGLTGPRPAAAAAQSASPPLATTAPAAADLGDALLWHSRLTSSAAAALDTVGATPEMMGDSQHSAAMGAQLALPPAAPQSVAVGTAAAAVVPSVLDNGVDALGSSACSSLQPPNSTMSVQGYSKPTAQAGRRARPPPRQLRCSLLVAEASNEGKGTVHGQDSFGVVVPPDAGQQQLGAGVLTAIDPPLHSGCPDVVGQVQQQPWSPHVQAEAQVLVLQAAGDTMPITECGTAPAEVGSSNSSRLLMAG